MLMLVNASGEYKIFLGITSLVTYAEYLQFLKTTFMLFFYFSFFTDFQNKFPQ